jgi:hypothetical protein
LDKANPRGSPLFSGIGITIGIIFLIGSVVAVWLNGGAIFSPGQVSAKSQPGVTFGDFHSHADFGSQCSYCHQPLVSTQTNLCLKCHTKVADQIEQHQGMHGRVDKADQCAVCHKEHRGSSFDPLQTALDTFNHNLTHFPLAGGHGDVACADCHKDGKYDQAQPECVTCHAEPKQHANLFGTDCVSCHTPTAWKPATFAGQAFDHASTHFSLVRHAANRQGQPMECANCHAPNMQPILNQDFDTQICITCHQKDEPEFMRDHLATFGKSCITCHDGVDRLHAFDHANFFPLVGRHNPAKAAITCDKCHANQQYRATPTDCVSCHKEPDIHAGSFGLKCQLCHNPQAWQPAKLVAHTFPPDHGKLDPKACLTCHTTSSYTQYTCYGCHDHQPIPIAASHIRITIDKDKLADCVACHLDGKVSKTQAP